LDFGCGEGAFLHRMHQHGWHVTGLDLYPKPVQRIQHDLGLPAFVGSLPHPELRPESFDVITMWHSLEHVHNPRDVLQHAYFLLAPGGQLMAAVPNIDSLPFQWFGKYWFGLDLPRHLTHFSPKSLHCLLARTGFRIKSMHMIRQSGWMRNSAQLAIQGSGKNRFRWHRWLQGKHLSRIATWYTFLRRQCDCLMVTAERRD
jgi:SAM-dependent methyltransferase